MAVRVNVTVLTCNRPALLARCLHTALSTMDVNDELTVLDDSDDGYAALNEDVVATSRRTRPGLRYLRVGHTLQVLRSESGSDQRSWQSRTDSRDIAPNRNLSLLIASILRARTTILVDDDVHGFDIDATERNVTAADGGSGIIWGSRIDGLSDLDTIERLLGAIRAVQSHALTNFCEAMQFAARSCAESNAEPAWPSGGYMAFRLLPQQVFAFPPGYNEDWLWCLLHRAAGDVMISCGMESVVHAPALVRRPQPQDINFEIAGDLVYDCLAALTDGASMSPPASLSALGAASPDRTFLPADRVQELLDEVQRLRNCAGRSPVGAIAMLEEYGLGVLGLMMHSGALGIDESAVLARWSQDAVDKHFSFAATLKNTSARAALKQALEQARL